MPAAGAKARKDENRARSEAQRGWERVKFSEAGGGESNLAIHGGKFPSISPRLV